MTTVEQQLRKAAADMLKIGAKFAVVGELAVSARAEPRMTRDADLAIAVQSDQEAERVIFAMQQLGYSVVAVIEQEVTGRMATVRLETAGSLITDLLFASSGIEQDIVERSTRISVIPGLVLPVASIGDLIAMKQTRLRKATKLDRFAGFPDYPRRVRSPLTRTERVGTSVQSLIV